MWVYIKYLSLTTERGVYLTTHPYRRWYAELTHSGTQYSYVYI